MLAAGTDIAARALPLAYATHGITFCAAKPPSEPKVLMTANRRQRHRLHAVAPGEPQNEVVDDRRIRSGVRHADQEAHRGYRLPYFGLDDGPASPRAASRLIADARIPTRAHASPGNGENGARRP